MAGFSRDSAIGIPVREFGPRRLLRPIRRLLRNSIPESSSSLVHFRVSGHTPNTKRETSSRLMALVLSTVHFRFLRSAANQETEGLRPVLYSITLPRPFFRVLPLYQMNRTELPKPSTRR